MQRSRGKAVRVERTSANAMMQEELVSRTGGKIWVVRRRAGLEETGRQAGPQNNVEFGL